MILLDGKATSQKILDNLKAKIGQLNIHPRLDIILVGDDPASLMYDQMKQKRAASVGIQGEIHHLPATATTAEVIAVVQDLNHNPQVTSFMIQLPLPAGLDTSTILNSIDPKKDADGLTATNLGLLFGNSPDAIPSATALGVIRLLDAYNLPVAGKQVVILNNTPVVGLPLLALLTHRFATVTITHEQTQNIKTLCSAADILISATGKGKMITADYVKENAVVIDIGLSPDPITGKLIGDVDFDSVASKAGYITPVPGGTGPMTIACLLENSAMIK